MGYAGAGIFAGGGTVDVQNNQFDSCAIGVQGAGGSSIISNNKFNGRGSKVLNGTVRTLFCDSPQRVLQGLAVYSTMYPALYRR